MSKLFACTLEKKETTTIKTIEFQVSKQFCAFIKTKDEEGKWSKIEPKKDQILAKIMPDMSRLYFINKMTEYSKEFNEQNKTKKYIVDDKYIPLKNKINFQYDDYEYEQDVDFEFKFYLDSKIVNYFDKKTDYNIKLFDKYDIKWFDGSWGANYLCNDKLYIDKNMCNKTKTKDDFMIQLCTNFDKLTYEICDEFRKCMLKFVKIYYKYNKDDNNNVDFTQFKEIY
jgi:hypothetical protein